MSSEAKIAISVDGSALAREAVEKVASAFRAVGDSAEGANPKLDLLTRAMRSQTDIARSASDAIGKSGHAFSSMGDSATAAARNIGSVIPQTSSFTSAMGLATAAAGAFGVSLGVGALASFARGILTDADALVKMSDKTGVSIEGLQRLRVAGDDAGVGLEDMTRAVNQMQNRLAGGDESAVGALKRLHLSLGDINQMEPDRQFMAIADAIRAVKSPADQVATAMDLFGKGGAEVLPVIKRGFDDVKDTAVGMSEEAVRTLDAAGDAMAKLSRQAMALAGEGLATVVGSMWDFLEITRELERVPPKFIDPKQQEAFEKFQATLAAAKKDAPPAASEFQGLGLKLTFVGDAALKLSDGLYAAAPLSKEAAALAKKHKEETERLAAAMKRHAEEAAKALRADIAAIEGTKDLALKTLSLTDAMVGVGSKGLIPSMKDLAIYTLRATSDVQALGFSVDELGRIGVFGADVLGDLNKHILTLPNVMPGATSALDAMRNATKDAREEMRRYGSALSDLSSGSIPGMIRGLMDLSKGWKDLDSHQKTLAVGAGIEGGLDIAANSVQGGTRGGAALKGAAQGAKIGTMILPGWGTAIGAGVGALAGALKVPQDEKDARAEFETFQKQFGTMNQTIAAVAKAYGEMGYTGERAQHDLAAALDATHHSAGDVKSALANINKVLGEQVTHAAAVDGAMGRLLGSVDALGIGLPDALKPMINDLLQVPGLSDIARTALQNLASGAGPNFKDLEAQAKGFGISLEALGPTFQAAHVTDEASNIINFLEKMKASGADMGGVAHGMADEISLVVQEALKFGTSVPENIHDMVKALAASGELLDENGQKIDDISTLKFGDPITSDVQKVSNAILELKKAIEDIPGALAKIPGSIPNPMANWGLPSFRSSDAPGELVYGGAQASGGDYLVNRPTMFLAGEAGPERASFMPLRSASRGASGASGVTVNLHVDLNALDGKSVEHWLQAGGVNKILRAIPDELRRLGAIGGTWLGGRM